MSTGSFYQTTPVTSVTNARCKANLTRSKRLEGFRPNVVEALSTLNLQDKTPRADASGTVIFDRIIMCYTR